MDLLYNSDQQYILSKLERNELLTLMEVKVILMDVNNFKLSQNPGIDIDTKSYCIDRQSMNEYISRKYSDSIYYLDNHNNIQRFYI